MIVSDDGHRYCVVCGKCIDDLHFNCKTCSPECRNKYSQDQYNNHKKVCKDCGKEFIGTYHQEYCEECHNKEDWGDRFKNKNPKITVSLVCYNCGKQIGTKEVNDEGQPRIQKAQKLCNECYEDRLKEISENMRINNPMFNKEFAEKSGRKRRKSSYNPKVYKKRDPSKPKKTLDEIKKGNSKRMKANNPMKNIITRMKVGFRLRSKYAEGKIDRRLGSARSWYKGGQKLNKLIRSRLNEWRQRELHRSNYTCELCGKQKTTFHIHHKKPLREVIDEACTRFSTTVKELNTGGEALNDLRNKVVDFIIDYHLKTLDLAMVLCSDCHDKIDKHYHKYKNENKKNNQRKFRG